MGRGGGPFGAVVVNGGRVVGRAHNRVTLDRDPTSHAEVGAIRAACRTLKSFRLSGCVLYASCEPCPLCLASSLWARIEKVFFAAPCREAARAGFDDSVFRRELQVRPAGRLLPVRRLIVPGARRPFDLWRAKPDKTSY